MSHLNPQKLHVEYLPGVTVDGPVLPRTYTLTHSDTTGDLFLTIAPVHNLPQISGIYTRIMRDEVLADWVGDGSPNLHVYCHVSGGLVFGSANWRESIFRYHMPMVLEAFRYGDQGLIAAHPELDQAIIHVHFQRGHKEIIEDWGQLGDYAQIPARQKDLQINTEET